jgi:hypothetical protein
MALLMHSSQNLWLILGRKLRMSLVFLLPLACSATHAYAENIELEYRVKSAFLYNFTKFIEWPVPEVTRSDFVMCVAGNSQFHANLMDTIGNKQNHNQQIIFNFIRHPSEARNCQLVFLDFADRESLREWVSSMAELAVLTVSDKQEFINMGGMIQFVIVDGKIRFDINQSAAKISSIKVSSKLLRLARNVN